MRTTTHRPLFPHDAIKLGVSKVEDAKVIPQEAPKRTFTQGLLLLYIGSAVLMILFYFSVKEWAFEQQMSTERELILSGIEVGPIRMVPAEAVANLPEPVQRYLQLVLQDEQPLIQTLQLTQTGQFRPGIDQGWMPLEAEQIFTTGELALHWQASVKAMPLIGFDARDQYDQGQGNMLVKVMSVYTVDDVSGPEIDQSALLRYLAEMPWFPTAFVDDSHVTWQAIDAYSAQATIRDHGLEASGIFTFNDIGEIVGFTTNERYRTVGNEQVNDPWGGVYGSYKDFDGIRIPTSAEVSWQLEGGEFSYARLTITAANFAY